MTVGSSCWRVGSCVLSPACGGETERGKPRAHEQAASPSLPSPASGGGAAKRSTRARGGDAEQGEGARLSALTAPQRNPACRADWRRRGGGGRRARRR